MVEVVRDIAGAHAQVMSSAELTIWARVDGASPERVQAALWEEKTLVKTWAMRGTLHLLPADELPLWVAAQGALKPRYEQPAWLRAYGLTRDQVERLLAGVSEALDGAMLTRDELATDVARRTGSEEIGERLRESFGSVLKPAAFRGELCFAPNAGRNVRFTRPDSWLGSWEPVETDVAVREVVRRYLGAYGPATREAFARWLGTPSPAQAERMIRSLGEEALVVDLEGARGWMLAADLERTRRARCDCYPDSTTTWWRDPGRSRPCSTPRTARASSAPRAGSRPSCSWTGASRASGATSARAGRSPSRSSPSSECRGRSGRPPRRRRSTWPASWAESSP
jgi:hypothetical protein